MPRSSLKIRRGQDLFLYPFVFRHLQIRLTRLFALLPTSQVIIITNSDDGWVKYSAERYLPNLLPTLKKYRIVSARTRYEKFYPNQPLCWKAAAFAHEVNEHFCSLDEALLDRECSNAKFEDVPDVDMVSTDDSSLGDSISTSDEKSLSPGSCVPSSDVDGKQSTSVSYRREIISFGDSMEERTAVKIVSDQLDAIPKSVMFLSNPTPTQIIGQLTMLTHHMNFVCEHASDLDLEISQKQAEKCAQSYLNRKCRSSDRQQRGYDAGPSIFQRILQVGSSCSSNPVAPLAGESDDIEQFDC